jgi:hypothetical protein
MSRRTLTADQQKLAEQLVEDLREQSEEVLREVAEILSSVPDEKIFGDTEFTVRDRILKLVATAFTARLAQKKTAMPAAPSSAPVVGAPPSVTIASATR